MFDAVVTDVRYAVRGLKRRPGFALLAIGVLTLAIAGNTTVFSALNAFLIRPLPYPDSDRIVMVYNSFPKMGLATGGSSIPDYLDRRAQAPSLENLAILTPASRALTAEEPATQLNSVRASPSLFSVLGVAPALGRVFTEDEATIGNEQVIVLSDRLWRTQFGARADVVGSDVEINGAPHRIVGVMPPQFGFPDRNIDAWLPFAFTPAQMSDQERGNDFSLTVGRLQRNASIEGLNAELDAIVQRGIERYPDRRSLIETTGFTGRATTLREYVIGNAGQTLYLLQGIVLAVLLTACANIASLQLARMIARRKEIAIRSSLGADRKRIARLVFVEMLVLTVTAAAAALVLARAGVALIRWLGLDESAQGIDIVLDGRVALFNVGVALLAALVATLAPLISVSRSNLFASARDAGLSDDGSGSHRVSNGLVVLQITMSFALLVGAGLLAKSYYQIQDEGPGFEATGVFTAKVRLPGNRYPDAGSQARFFDRMLEALRAIPGVSAVGYASALPFGGDGLGASLVIDGYEPPVGEPPAVATLNSINEGYFPSLSVPMLQGRNFAATETERVVIVDDVFAQLYFPDDSPLGQRVRIGGPATPGDWYTVVGVVPAIQYISLAEPSTAGATYSALHPTTYGWRVRHAANRSTARRSHAGRRAGGGNGRSRRARVRLNGYECAHRRVTRPAARAAGIDDGVRRCFVGARNRGRLRRVGMGRDAANQRDRRAPSARCSRTEHCGDDSESRPASSSRWGSSAACCAPSARPRHRLANPTGQRRRSIGICVRHSRSQCSGVSGELAPGTQSVAARSDGGVETRLGTPLPGTTR